MPEKKLCLSQNFKSITFRKGKSVKHEYPNDVIGYIVTENLLLNIHAAI